MPDDAPRAHSAVIVVLVVVVASIVVIVVVKLAQTWKHPHTMQHDHQSLRVKKREKYENEIETQMRSSKTREMGREEGGAGFGNW